MEPENSRFGFEMRLSIYKIDKNGNRLFTSTSGTEGLELVRVRTLARELGLMEAASMFDEFEQLFKKLQG